VRVVDHDIKPGVQLDMGDGDAWPQIRAQMVDADILIISTPTWTGQQSSVCQRVLERLDAGFTIPAQGITYWNGEAMHSTDFKDLDQTPDGTAATTATAAANAAHLARLLRGRGYPPVK
jgi:multimeric flavodoxin WrbA